MATENIKAGGAYLEVTAKDDGLRATLKSADAFIEKWTRDVKKQMSSAAVKMGASFATVGASITAGFGLLKEIAEKLKDSFVSAFEDMKTNGTDSQKQAAEELQTAWGNLHDAWMGGLQEIIAIFGGSLADGLNGASGLLGSLTEKLHENKNIISENVGITSAWIGGFVSGLPACLDLIKNIGIGIANVGITIANLPGKMYEWLKSFEPIRKVVDYVGRLFGMEGLSELKIPEIEKLDYVDSSAEREKKQSSEAAKVRAEDNIEKWKKDNGMMNRISDIASGDNLKNSEMDEAEKYISELEKTYGDLGITVDRTTGKIEGLAEAQEKINAAQQEGRRKDLIDMGLPTLQVDNGNFNPGASEITPEKKTGVDRTDRAESSAIKSAAGLVEDNKQDQMSDEEREKYRAQKKYDDIYNARVEELRGEYGDRAEGMAQAELVDAWEATQQEITRIDEKYRAKEADEEKKRQEEQKKKDEEAQKKLEEEQQKYWEEMQRQQEEYKAQQIEQLNKQIDSIEQAQNDSKKTYSSAGTFSAWDQIDANASLEKSIADNNKQQLTEQKKMVDYLRELVEMYEDSEDYDPSFTFA